MFIREKKQAHKVYLYLEHRFYEDNKVKSKSIYLGQRERAKAKLIELLNTGIINQNQFDKFSEELPVPIQKEPKKKTIMVEENEYTTMQTIIQNQAKEIQILKSQIENFEFEKKLIAKRTLEKSRKEKLKLKEKIQSLERFIDDLQARQ